MSRRYTMLRSAVMLLLAILATPLTAALGAQGTPEASPELECATGDMPTWQAQMDAYATAGDYATLQEEADGAVSQVLIELPPIEFTGEGQSATLPVGPCQYIYRYQYADIQAPEGAAQPFQYAEIDWNTEGSPRGPNGSFSSAHFDFHFYLPSREEIENDLTCVSSNGKTCDSLLTDYEQTRRFQHLPEPALIPETYRPDVGSAIPAMGLHILDMSAEYTVEAVNHTPVLIYGTYDGRIVFAQASVTLFTMQDAMAAPDHRIAFPFHQPEAFDAPIDWPTEFVIEYLPDTGGFRIGFKEFQYHDAE